MTVVRRQEGAEGGGRVKMGGEETGWRMRREDGDEENEQR